MEGSVKDKSAKKYIIYNQQLTKYRRKDSQGISSSFYRLLTSAVSGLSVCILGFIKSFSAIYPVLLTPRVLLRPSRQNPLSPADSAG